MKSSLAALLVFGLFGERAALAQGTPDAARLVDTRVNRGTAQASAPAPQRPAGRRGRWGGAIGVGRFGVEGTYDFRNSSTPLAGTIGPYTGAAITADYNWIGPYASFGYRGPITASGKVGFGIEGEIAGNFSLAPNLTATGTSAAGVPVTFSLERGGLKNSGMFGFTGHLSWNVLPSLNLMAGGKATRLQIGSSWGSYKGPGQSNVMFFGVGRFPRFALTNVAPWIGAEYLFANHASVQIEADFVSTGGRHLTDTPWSLTVSRHRVSMTAAIRFFV